MKLLGKTVSKHFESFYQDVVSRIGIPKFYPDPPDELLGTCCLEDGVFVIRLKTDMSKPRFEENAAHELAHALQRVEGFPTGKTRLPDESVIVQLGTFLVSLVLDLNVEDRLKQRSFDSASVIDAQYQNLKRALMGQIPPLESPEWCKGTMMYARVSLTQPPRRWNKLRTLHLQHAPHIVEKGEEIAAILRKHGWDNPDQALASMVAIRDSLGLPRGQINIVDVRTGEKY